MKTYRVWRWTSREIGEYKRQCIRECGEYNRQRFFRDQKTCRKWQVSEMIDKTVSGSENFLSEGSTIFLRIFNVYLLTVWLCRDHTICITKDSKIVYEFTILSFPQGEQGIIYKASWRGMPVVAKTIKFSEKREHNEEVSHSPATIHQRSAGRCTDGRMKQEAPLLWRWRSADDTRLHDFHLRYFCDVVSLRLECLSHQRFLQDFYREVSIMSHLRHPNLVLFLGACLEDSVSPWGACLCAKIVWTFIFDIRIVVLFPLDHCAFRAFCFWCEVSSSTPESLRIVPGDFVRIDWSIDRKDPHDYRYLCKRKRINIESCAREWARRNAHTHVLYTRTHFTMFA